MDNKKWNVGWGVTSVCNMACEFCYSKTVRQSGDDRNLEKCISFIDENHSKINSINYGTGENVISPDWFSLIDHIRKQYPEITQAVTTNGYLSHQMLADKRYCKIVVNSIDEVDISLDFCNPEKHNKFRGNPNAFGWALKMLELCREYGMKPTIVFIGTNATLNKENLEGLFAIAKEYRAKLRMNIFRPTRGIDDKSRAFIASYQSIIEILRWINENHKILALSDPLFCSILTEDASSLDPSGNASMRILHTGDITPSTYLISNEFRMTKIEDCDLDSVRLENELPPDCMNCRLKNRCGGGALDRRYLWYKNLKERDPYCPFREENYVPDFLVHIKGDESFSSVHDGYLPTLFFDV